jgi:hypothetical protein
MEVLVDWALGLFSKLVGGEQGERRDGGQRLTAKDAKSQRGPSRGQRPASASAWTALSHLEEYRHPTHRLTLDWIAHAKTPSRKEGLLVVSAQPAPAPGQPSATSRKDRQHLHPAHRLTLDWKAHAKTPSRKEGLFVVSAQPSPSPGQPSATSRNTSSPAAPHLHSWRGGWGVRSQSQLRIRG